MLETDFTGKRPDLSHQFIFRTKHSQMNQVHGCGMTVIIEETLEGKNTLEHNLQATQGSH